MGYSGKRQGGYVLLLTLLAFMGIGGVVASSFTQEAKIQVEHERFLHNERVLREAKQALLQYAYNYPDFNSEGPGRLPCPDDDNDGLTGPLTLLLCTSIGRLPWFEPDLNFYDARDASGERLWYAVSDAFYNLGGGPVINSSSVGTITIQDQSGSIKYDGRVSGLAAVIIAPGPAIDRAGIAQDRAADENDPANYLDLFGAVDNADFVNNSTNGFILGPVVNPSTGALVINDQFIVITTEELIAVAEKAVLQTYQKEINDYLEIVGGVYPWLYNYVGVANIPGLNSYYPADSNFATELSTNLDNFGRVPSIFGVHFAEMDSQSIESKLGGSLSITFPITPTPVGSSSSGNLLFNGGSTVLNFQTADKLTDVRFMDIADIVGQDGRLTGTVVTPEFFSQVIYFWDEDEAAPTGVWTVCPDGGDVISDCHRDSSQVPNPGGPNESKEEILRVILELDFSGVVNFDTDYTTAPSLVHDPADGTKHASITATFTGADVILGSLPLTVRYEIDRHYHEGVAEVFDIDESGTLDLNDLNSGATLALSMRYYPELPAWAFSNGWHGSLMLAYANDYRPDLNAAAGDCVLNPPCLQINGLGGINDDKISILVLAGEHIWVDGDVNPPVAADGSFVNEVGDVFNLENSDLDRTFDIRSVEATGAPGDRRLDQLLVIN